MDILEDGMKEDLGDGHYKILFNWPKIGQPKAFYRDRLGPLGAECLDRTRVVNAIVRAKEEGYFIVVSGRCGWHTLYKPYVDEYYGVQEWTKKEKPDHVNFILKRIGSCEINKGLPTSVSFEFEKYELPKPSKKALEIAESKLKEGKFVTIGAMKRNSFEMRDFHDWPNLVGKLKELGFKVYATCPRAGGVHDLDCQHIEDFSGYINLMDAELAMHSLSSACFAANTGVQGLMLLANSDYVFSFKGDSGPHGCGWSTMHNSLTKREDYKTKLIKVDPTYGPDNEVTKNIIKTMNDLNIKG